MPDAVPDAVPDAGPDARLVLGVDRGVNRGLDRVVALIPALNEEASLPGVLAALLDQGVSQVLVVDNGSTDRTAELARAGGAQVVSEPRRGYGMACLTGLRALARRPGGPPQVVLFLDGDQSDDPSAVLRILGPVLRGDADLVIGRRRGAGDAPPRQRLGTAS
jgi:glycosyltransferase involved in cell wall biosynthesis